MTERKVLVIVNGNINIGYGHISRTLLIGNKFKEHKNQVFYCIPKGNQFQENINIEGFNTYCVESFTSPSLQHELEKIIATLQINIVLLDLIEDEFFNFTFLGNLRDKVLITSITLFDFPFKDRFEHVSFYPDFVESKLETHKTRFGTLSSYTGKDYMIIRSEFKRFKNKIKEKANSVLVTMGMTDPYNLSEKVIGALLGEKYRVRVLMSKSAESYSRIRQYAIKTNNLEVVEKVTNIEEEVIASDIVVLNGGLTRYEVCITGTPFIAISLHKQQFEITEKLTRFGVGVNLGVYTELTSEEIRSSVEMLLNDYTTRLNMSTKSEGLVNANDGAMIVEKILNHERILMK